MLNKTYIKKIFVAGLGIVLDKLRKFGVIDSLSEKSFRRWWVQFKSSNQVPQDLILMVDYHISTKAFETTSGHWRHLNKKHIELLNKYTIENFKQTIEKLHYWGEEKLDSVLLKNIINDPVTIQVRTDEIYRSHDFCSKNESIQHNLGIIVLLNYLVNNGYYKHFNLIQEPLFGNPIFIKYNDRRVSFSLLTSLLEINFIGGYLDLKNGLKFLEVGAGSGRTAFALMTLLPHSKYIIVDIPPALFISQENMIRNFPDKKIFKFRRIIRYEDVEDELNSSDFAFLTPDQMKFIPDNHIDVAIAIDSLHEMTTADVENYFNMFDRIARYLFFKCQITQWTKTSNVLYTIDTYPVRDHWKKLVHEKSYVPNDYFNAIYKL